MQEVIMDGKYSDFEDIQRVIIDFVVAILNLPKTATLNASFPALGGDSIQALSLSISCRRQGVFLPVDRILRENSISELARHATRSIQPNALPDLCQTATSAFFRKPLDRLEQAQGWCLVKGQNTTFDDKSTCLVSSNMLRSETQLSLIAGSQQIPGCNIILFLDTYKAEHLPVMRNAWKQVIEKEPIFAASGAMSSTKEGRSVTAEDRIKWTEVFVQDEGQQEMLQKELLLDSAVDTSFLVISSADDNESKSTISTIIWRVHHALIDGTSASIVYRKVRQAASGFSILPSPEFVEVTLALERFHGTMASYYTDYWRQKSLEFPNAAGTIDLPPPAKSLSSSSWACQTIHIPINGIQLSEFARDVGVTLAAVHYSLWALVLSFYTDSDRVVFGAVLSGRDLPIPGASDTIGPLINTLPFYAAISSTQSTIQFVVRNFQNMLDLEAVQASRSEDGFRRDFQSAIALQMEIRFEEPSVICPLKDNTLVSASATPLSIMIQRGGGASLMYHAHKYRADDMELLVRVYGNAADSLITTGMTLGTLMSKLHSDVCLQKALQFGNSESLFSRHNSISDDLVSLFEKIVSSSPDLIAVAKGNVTITYLELDVRASLVARYLEKTVLPGEAVCIHADRSENWIIGIYGILKAGCVYAPLDPLLPAQVRSANFLASRSRAFLPTDISSKDSCPSNSFTCLSVSEIVADTKDPAPDPYYKRAPRHPKPHDAAYISFTSGSTGTPKAVLCSHESLVAFQADQRVRLYSEPGCSISQVMSPAFDGSIHEIFSALSYGAKLVLPTSGDFLANLRDVDSAILTPSLANVLDPDSFPRLKNVYLVGEPVPQNVSDTWASRKSVYNMYGPTEATCGATIKRLLCGEPVTVGRPNRSCRIYILNSKHRILPPGVVGNIYIAGIQVARGYLGQIEETAKKFLPDTVNPSFREQMYATGDKGLWTHDGEIVLMGRNDRQIKLNGFRLDLNALETSAAQAIPEATAVAMTLKDEDLIAVFQSSIISQSTVRARLSTLLPTYAMPKYIVVMERLPLTTAGKMDYKAIASLSMRHGTYQQDIYFESLSLTEQKIADVWREVLKLDPCTPITYRSNFSALGGHSILQLQLAYQLSKVFHRQIEMRMIIKWCSLRDYGNAIQKLISPASRLPTEASTYKVGEHELSPTEKGWWHKYESGACTTSSNLSLLYSFDAKAINRQRLRIAWNVALARYPILSSRFVSDPKGEVKRLYFEAPPRIQRRKIFLPRHEVNRPFILDKDYPIRVLISKTRLLVCASHIICDYAALGVLLRDVSDLYRGASLEPVRLFYNDTLWKAISVFEIQTVFWRTYLAGIPDLQMAHMGNPPSSFCKGTSRVCQIKDDLCRKFFNFARQNNFTSHQIALAAVSLALQSPCDTVDIVLGSPWLNRGPADLNTVGLFLQALPIRVTYTPSNPTESSELFLRAVQRTSQSAVANAVPWPYLLSVLGIKTVLPYQPLFDVMITFHDVPAEPLLPITGFHQHLTWSEGAKFQLMCEFTAISEDKILLRLEYDDFYFTDSEVEEIEHRVLEAMYSLIRKLSFSETRSRIVEQELADAMWGTSVAFAKKL